MVQYVQILFKYHRVLQNKRKKSLTFHFSNFLCFLFFCFVFFGLSQGETDGLEGLPAGEKQKKYHHGFISSSLWCFHISQVHASLNNTHTHQRGHPP